MSVYLNNFDCWEDVLNAFGGIYEWDSNTEASKKFLANNPEPEKVFYANYDTDSYEGSALVIWYDKGKYYFLQGSHCSCYGLEESGFDPEVYDTKKVFLQALEKMNYVYTLSQEDFKDLIEVIRKYRPKKGAKNVS